MIRAVCFAALLLLLGPVLVAQMPALAGSPALCKPKDIDFSFFFADVPVGHQTIGLNLHNTGAQSCALRDELAPSFAVDAHGAVIKTCWLCKANGDLDREAMMLNDRFLLPAGEYAHVRYRWSSSGEICQKFDWVVFGAVWQSRASFFFEESHWKPHICSAIEISGYKHGQMPESLSPLNTDASLQVTLNTTPLYADEWAELTLELKSPNGSITPTGHCPELDVVYQDRFQTILPDGYEELINTAGKGGMYASGYGDDLPAQFKGYTRRCDTQGNSNRTTVTLPASMLAHLHFVPSPNVQEVRRIAWRAMNAATQEPVFVTAETNFTVLDPGTLAPNWGAKVKGIGAGLSVDRQTYTLSERIPLHLHWENFAATEPLAVGECGEPGPGLEVQDSSHKLVASLPIIDFGCEGHGWGPFAVKSGEPKGDLVTLQYVNGSYFLSEGGDGVSISVPGTYYLLVVWSPPTLIKKTDGSKDFDFGDYTFGAPYATARSLPVRIEILPRKDSSSPMNP